MMQAQNLKGKSTPATYAAWAFLILSPWLMMGLLSLLLGKNVFTALPVWSDEIALWRSVYSFRNAGLQTGLSGFAEYAAPLGALGVSGPTPLLLYGLFSFLFGLSYHSILLFNLIWISLGALTLCFLLRPRAPVAAFIGASVLCYAPLLLYAATSMTELFNYALWLFYAAFALRYARTKGKPSLVLCCVTAFFACTYRPFYGFLFILPIVLACGRKIGKIVLWSLAAVAASALACLVQWLLTCPNPTAFLYNWLQAPDFTAFTHMLLGHTKANLLAFLRGTGNVMQDTLRIMYVACAAVCSVGAFFGIDRKRRRLYCRFDSPLLCGALLLWLPLLWHLLFAKMGDWSDFRYLAPIAWGCACLLLLQKRWVTPALTLAGGLVMSVILLASPAMGSFADEQRFAPPAYSADISNACREISYDSGATDPYANSVRTDLSSIQAASELDARLGIQYGWFSPETLGQSRWLLTDHLKLAVSGYAPVYEGKDGQAYRLTGPNMP